jgi:hypothetical protein
MTIDLLEGGVQTLYSHKNDELVRSQEKHFSVIPAKAGIQVFQGLLDPGFRRGDGLEDFLRVHQK